MSRPSLGRATLLIASVLGALALYSSAAYASGPPIVTVGAANNLTLNTATLNGTVDSNGASTTYKFEYGKSKSYGKSTTVKTIKTGSSPVSELLVGLENLATYHFRVSATNSFGTTVSEDVQFEMLLRWKANGIPLSEVWWAGKYPSAYRAEPEWPNPENKGTFKVAGLLILTDLEISCKVDTYEHEGRGVLESEYKLNLEGCVTKLNGTTANACKPSDMTLVFNSVFVVGGTQALTLGSGSCPIGKKIELAGAGFGVGPMAEQLEQPISLTASLPAYSGLTMTYGSKWVMTGAAVNEPFGIS